MIDQNTSLSDALLAKASLKQKVYRQTKTVFNELNDSLTETAAVIGPEVFKKDKTVDVDFNRKGEFESQLKFSGDTLVFMMHTNTFTFEPKYFVHNTPYVQEDPCRAYFGMILVYNFLSDSIKYKRLNDVGYLVARIFVNLEKHFFVEGPQQFSFQFSDISTRPIDKTDIQGIINTAIVQSLEFDLFVPPMEMTKAMTLNDKVMISNYTGKSTGKRLGFEQTYMKDGVGKPVSLKDIQKA